MNVNKNLGKTMIPTEVCLFYEVSETILLLGLRYLHLDLLQFLYRDTSDALFNTDSMAVNAILYL